MGFSFKENCNDLRNTQVIKLYKKLKKELCNIDIYDPIIKEEDAKNIYNINLIKNPKFNYYDAIIIAVAHNRFKEMGIKNIKKLSKSNSVIYDLKYLFDQKDTDIRL